MTRWQNLQKSNLGGLTFGFLWHHCLDWIVQTKTTHSNRASLSVFSSYSGCFVSYSSHSCSHRNISLKVRLHHQDCARLWSNFDSQDSLFSTNVLRLSQRFCSFHFPFFCFLKQFRDNRFGDLGQQSKKGCRLGLSIAQNNLSGWTCCCTFYKMFTCLSHATWEDDICGYDPIAEGALGLR